MATLALCHDGADDYQCRGEIGHWCHPWQRRKRRIHLQRRVPHKQLLLSERCSSCLQGLFERLVQLAHRRIVSWAGTQAAIGNLALVVTWRLEPEPIRNGLVAWTLQKLEVLDSGCAERCKPDDKTSWIGPSLNWRRQACRNVVLRPTRWPGCQPVQSASFPSNATPGQIGSPVVGKEFGGSNYRFVVESSRSLTTYSCQMPWLISTEENWSFQASWSGIPGILVCDFRNTQRVQVGNGCYGTA